MNAFIYAIVYSIMEVGLGIPRVELAPILSPRPPFLLPRFPTLLPRMIKLHYGLIMLLRQCFIWDCLAAQELVGTVFPLLLFCFVFLFYFKLFLLFLKVTDNFDVTFGWLRRINENIHRVTVLLVSGPSLNISWNSLRSSNCLILPFFFFYFLSFLNCPKIWRGFAF